MGRFNGTVFGILALTLFIYVTVVFCVILPWLSWSVPGVLNLALLTLSTSTALACFLACVMVDPGRYAAGVHLEGCFGVPTDHCLVHTGASPLHAQPPS